MFKTTFALLLTLFLSINLTASDTAKDKYKMFPEAKEGYTRTIVDVPKTQNDYDHKVELLIGKSDDKKRNCMSVFVMTPR